MRKRKKWRYEFGERVCVGKTYAEYLAIAQKRSAPLLAKRKMEADKVIKRLQKERGPLLTSAWKKRVVGIIPSI